MYESLKSLPARTGLQERLVLLVHLRKQKQRLTEMQITALANSEEHNAKALQSLVATYRNQLFPGIDKVEEKDDYLVQARKALVEEAKRVYLVTPAGSVEGNESLQRALLSENEDMRKWAAHEIHKETMKEQRKKKSLFRGAKPPKADEVR